MGKAAHKISVAAPPGSIFFKAAAGGITHMQSGIAHKLL